MRSLCASRFARSYMRPHPNSILISLAKDFTLQTQTSCAWSRYILTWYCFQFERSVKELSQSFTGFWWFLKLSLPKSEYAKELSAKVEVGIIIFMTLKVCMQAMLYDSYFKATLRAPVGHFTEPVVSWRECLFHRGALSLAYVQRWLLEDDC